MLYNYSKQDEQGATDKDLARVVSKMSYKQQLNLGMLIAMSEKPGLTYDQAHSYSLTQLVLNEPKLIDGLKHVLTFGLDSMEI